MKALLYDCRSYTALFRSKMINRTLSSGQINTNEIVNVVKRKVAFICSFVGTNYSGMQYSHDGHKAIENMLMDALYKANCVIPSNSLDPTKIGWSRSSRTDRGVHAARVIVGAKLEIDSNWVDKDLRISQVPVLLNALLPPDIKVFSCVKVNSRFDARDKVDWREYEYVIPLDILTHNTSSESTSGDPSVDTNNQQQSDPQTLLDKLNFQLQKMEGSHSFHNFHRSRDINKPKVVKLKSRDDTETGNSTDNQEDVNRSEVIERTKGKAYRDKLRSEESNTTSFNQSVSVGSASETTVNAVDNISIDGTVTSEDTTLNNGQQTTSETTPNETETKSMYSKFGYKPDRYHLDDWMPVDAVVCDKTRGTMYRVKASLFDLPYTNSTNECDNGNGGVKQEKTQKMIRINVCGQSFLMHQIRLMVSTAILAARGQLPPNIIDIALTIPYKISLPMVPAEGLVLLDAGFAKKVGGKDVALSTTTYKHPRRFNPNSTHQTPANVENFSFMTESEYAESERFKEENISTEIRDAWLKNDKELMKVWLLSTTQWKVPSELATQWTDLYTQQMATKQGKRSGLTEKELFVIEMEIKKFRESHLPQGFTTIATYMRNYRPQSGAKALFQPSSAEVSSKHSKSSKPYSTYLPKGIAGKMTTAFNTVPGPIIHNTLRALATMVVLESIPFDYSVEELIDYVKSGIRDSDQMKSESERGTSYSVKDLEKWLENKYTLVLIR